MRTRHLLAVGLLGLTMLAGCAAPGTGTGGPAISASVPSSSAGAPSPSLGGVLPSSGKSVPAGVLTLNGTIEAGVEPGCLLLTQDSKKYLLIGGDPDVVKAGATVTVTGSLETDIRSYCMQGLPFKVTSAQPG